jgi:hypothetical protein
MHHIEYRRVRPPEEDFDRLFDALDRDHNTRQDSNRLLFLPRPESKADPMVSSVRTIGAAANAGKGRESSSYQGVRCCTGLHPDEGFEVSAVVF